MTNVGLLLEQCLAPVPGGIGRYSREVARALAATAGPDDSVEGWTAWHADLTAATIPAVGGPHRLPLPPRVLAAAWARRRGPAPAADVVHAPGPLFPPRRADSALVVTVHDVVAWSHPDTLTRHGAGWHRRMISAAVREADVIVVPTQAVADDLQSWVGTPHRLAVVGEGASPDLVLPADADERARRLRLPGDGYLATLATLEPRKGLDVAVAALADSAAPDLPLVVAGQRGWGRVDLRQVAARHQIPLSRLRLLGRLDDADLAVVLSRASVVLVPSRAEGFGLPAVEAMQLDTPVVVTDVPALVEVAGDAADVVPVDDPSALAVAAAKAAADPGARAKQRAARVRRYDWKITATRLWELYREARAERTKGVPA